MVRMRELLSEYNLDLRSKREKRRAKHPDSIDGHLLDLLLLDAGLRLGEAIALQWGDLELPDREDDTSRVLHVRRALSREKRAVADRSALSPTVADAAAPA